MAKEASGRFRSIRGTRDLLPAETQQWRAVEETVHKVMGQWGYGEIRTPAFEQTELFKRSVGEDSDIVSKQMYTFLDQRQTSLTLKPELTAPVMRAYIQNNMSRDGALTKLYYVDALFRQERPQAGRLRQFHQFGAEAIGSPNPEQDAEVIALVYTILGNLGLSNLKLYLNSIGSKDSRSHYRKALVDFLTPHRIELSKTSQKRLETNPLRVLDTKEPNEQTILQDAPTILDYLDDNDRNHYEEVKQILHYMNIPFSDNPMMVRGLDYYSHTTFEIISHNLGAQNALCGGGRYDDLIEELGGKATPAVGFAAGIERILLALEGASASPENGGSRIYVVAASDGTRETVIKLAMNLRSEGLVVDFDTLRRSLKAQMREANRLKASHTVIIGDEELKGNIAQVKTLTTGEQEPVPFESLPSFFVSP